MVHEFTTTISVSTPLGDGEAILIECENHDNFWTVILDNGAIVTFRQEKIRAGRSYTYGRGINDQEMIKIIKHKWAK